MTDQPESQPAPEPAGDEPTAVRSDVTDPVTDSAPAPVEDRTAWVSTATATPVTDGPPAWTPPPPASAPSEPASGGASALPADRPEVAIGAAFAGGLVVALILKRLAR